MILVVGTGCRPLVPVGSRVMEVEAATHACLIGIDLTLDCLQQRKSKGETRLALSCHTIGGVMAISQPGFQYSAWNTIILNGTIDKRSSLGREPKDNSLF